MTDAKANHPKYRFRIYLGTEDQQPDPLIKKHVPANAAPAHRGLVYIVFENLPLDEFGNRVPPITAEVSWGGAQDAVANRGGREHQLRGRALVASIRRATARFCAPARSGIAGAAEPRHHDRGVPAPDLRDLPGRDAARSRGVVDGRGNLFVFGNTTGTRIVKIDGDSLSATADALIGTNGSTLEILSIYDLAGRHDFVLWVRLPGHGRRACTRPEDLSHYWTAPTACPRVLAASVAGPAGLRPCRGLGAGVAPTTVGGGPPRSWCCATS